MSAPLTNNQKIHLARLGLKAWNAAKARAGEAGEEFALDEAEWRHQEVAKACGKLGLRCCSQDDYKLVEGHFMDLLGEPGKALDSFVRGATNPRRVAEYKLLEACKEFGFSVAYADAICRRQNHGLTLEDVSERVLWRLVYTVRNRGLARRREAARGRTPAD